MAWSAAANAYRPFDGTDAGVAETGSFELELEPVGYTRQGDKKWLTAPAVVANWGVEPDSEIVLEGAVNLPRDEPENYRAQLNDTKLSYKHVFVNGGLQGGTGVSVAGECGMFLPTIHGSDDPGGTCAAIASQKFAAATVHLNALLGHTRDRRWDHFLGVIVEGPEAMPVRPVAEVYADHDDVGSRTRSLLLGAIWKKSENLSFDCAVRRARTDGERVTELRLGLTWSFERGE